jgi:O-antigen biosynthesis protein
MDLSVIIVNYNVRHFLEQCLYSVRKASGKISCEIIVVDNNSADGSDEMIARLFPDVKLIRNTENKGFSAANNQAIRIAGGSFILLLNPDTLVEEDAFYRCIEFMNNQHQAGALGVMMINGNGRLLPESKRAVPTPETAFFKMAGLSSLFPRSAYFNRYYLGHLDSSATAETEIISGAFMFIRKEALDKTGLLDESFFMYGEDIDLSYRILKAGYKNYYFPDVRIIHYKGESTSKENINYVVQFYKAMLIFAEKHFTGNVSRSYLLFINIAVYFWGFNTILRISLRKIISPLLRVTRTLLEIPVIRNLLVKTKRILVVGDNEAVSKIKILIDNARKKYFIAGRVSAKNKETGNDALGNLGQLREVVKKYKIDEIIFSRRELSTCQIISSMQLLAELNISIKIVSTDENLIIGSKSILNKSSN